MSTAFTIRRIPHGELTSDDLRAMENINCTAFKNHEFHVITTRNRPDMWVLVEVRGAAAGGEVYLAEIDGKAVAAAGVYPPGTDFLHLSDEGKEGVLGPFATQAEPDLQEWFMGSFVPEYTEHATKAFGLPGKLDNYHIQTLCVLPEVQGQGIGRKLIEHIREIAISQRSGLSIEASNETNVARYRKIGFTLLDKVVIRGPDPLNEDLLMAYLDWKH